MATSSLAPAKIWTRVVSSQWQRHRQLVKYGRLSPATDRCPYGIVIHICNITTVLILTGCRAAYVTYIRTIVWTNWADWTDMPHRWEGFGNVLSISSPWQMSCTLINHFSIVLYDHFKPISHFHLYYIKAFNTVISLHTILLSTESVSKCFLRSCSVEPVNLNTIVCYILYCGWQTPN